MEKHGKRVENCRISVGKVWKKCGKSVEKVWGKCGRRMEQVWENGGKSLEKSVGKVWEKCGKSVEKGLEKCGKSAEKVWNKCVQCKMYNVHYTLHYTLYSVHCLVAGCAVVQPIGNFQLQSLAQCLFCAASLVYNWTLIKDSGHFKF